MREGLLCALNRSVNIKQRFQVAFHSGASNHTATLETGYNGTMAHRTTPQRKTPIGG